MAIGIFSHIGSLFNGLIATLRNRPRASGFALVAVIIIGLVLVRADEGDSSTPPEIRTPTVTLASIGALQSRGIPVTLTGEVRSVSQAELRTQSSGEVVRVHVRAGQYVAAGTVLAELEHAAESAAVLQAQGGLAAAQANLARVQAGARTEDKASATARAESAAIAYAQAQDSASDAYASAYAAAQDAVFAKADTFFRNPYTTNPEFTVNSATYDEQQELKRERVALGDLLDAWSTKASLRIEAPELDAALQEAQTNLDRVKRFVDRIAYFISKQKVTEDRTNADIAAQSAIMGAGQQGLEASRAGVASARTALAAAASASTASSLSESKLVVGERPEDIAAAEAQVVQARGVLAGARALLENTLIRTPIAGTVTSLSLSRGDFVTQGSSAAVVANEGAQEIVAYVSENLLDLVVPGSTVLIGGLHTGTVTSRDPGLDPSTKRARITISVPNDANLVNGSFAELAVRADAEDSETGTSRTHDRGVYLPLTAIKVRPDGLAIFTVRDDHTLEAHPIAEGTLIGDRMLVPNELPRDMRIVVDVRGRIEDETVSVVEE